MQLQKALEKCKYICSQREYCIHDIEEKLTNWDVESSKHHIIIKTLITEKYINHDRYTAAFLNDKLIFNHWGKIKLRFHLKQKNIEDSIIKKHLDAIDISTYNQIIFDEIEKKRRLVKGANDFDKKQKVARYIISKGFEPNKVFELLKME